MTADCIVIFPTEGESLPFRRLRPDVEVRISGVGQALAAATTAQTIIEESPACLILAGIAGAYPESGLERGEVCCVHIEREAMLPERFAATFQADILPAGMRHVVANTAPETCIAAQGAAIENMEGAAVIALCRRMGVKVCECRAISNFVGEPFERWSIREATENLAIKLSEIIDYFQKHTTL